MSCNCDKSALADKDNPQNLTRDLRIIKNKNLDKITCNGTKYCEYKTINFNEDKESSFHGLNQCLSSWCNKKDMSKRSLSEWKHLVNNEMERKINLLKEKHVKYVA